MDTKPASPQAQNSPTPPPQSIPTSDRPMPAPSQSSPSSSGSRPNPPNSPPPPPTPNSTAPTPPPKPSAIKQSPFRFLFPVIIVFAILGIIIFLISKVISLPFASKSSPNSAKSPAPTEITYWGLWEPSAIFSEVIADFQSQYPHITINYQQKSPQDYRERLQNELQSGSGPDIFRFHHTWTPIFKPYLSLVPPTAYSASEYQQTFYPIVSTWLKDPKGYLGIPLMFDGLGLYYNQTIFESAGLTPPSTWDELRQIASQLTIRNETGQIQRAGVALGTADNIDHFSDILGLMLLQNSADPSLPNNSLGQDALKFYTIFSQVDRVWDATLPNSTRAFADEKVAMILAPSWRAHEIKALNPNIKFAIAPAPQLPGTNISWASFWVEGVSSKTTPAKQQAAWEFLTFLSQKEVLRKLYTNASTQRLFGEPFPRTDMADQLVGDPYVGAFIKDAPQSQSWFLASRTFDNGLNDRIISYYQDAVNAINNSTSIESALTTAEQGISQVLTQFGINQQER